MSRDFFGLEKGIRISEENSDSNIILFVGQSAPSSSQEFLDAEIGSMYLRIGTNETYKKGVDTGSISDWELQGSAVVGTWRPEKVRAVSVDSVVSGVARDLTANPFSDDEGTQLTAADFTEGEFAILDNVLYEVTDVTSPNVTFTTSNKPLQEADTFVAINYLPDSPAGQEGQAIVTYNGTVIIKIADIDWNFADGISLAAGYSAASGDVTASDTVQSALEKIDGNNDAQDSVLGTSQGDTDLGTFGGSTISDNTSVKGALGELELANEEVDQNVDDLITLSGMPENSIDLGVFTGSVIPDNSNVKGALQALESKDEAQDLVVAEIDQNVDDLIALSGVPENSTNLGTFTGFGGALLTATETVKTAIQKITDFLGGLRTVEVTGITTETAVDQVPIASVSACKWFVYAFEEANPTNKRAWEVWALNDGTSSRETVTNKLRFGSFNFSINTDVSGGNMRLLAESSTAGVTVRARRIEVVAP